LYRISPICAETVAPHIGRRVCVVMNDGTEHIGVLCGIGDGKLYLEPDGGLTLSARKKDRRNPSKRGKVRTKAFWGYPYPYPYGFGWGIAAFDIALIATLFLLPFFFI